MSIHLLPPEVASQIAAGEVVERPASVVKELLENALDAGAKVITLKVEGAGKTLIEVADDGSGIPVDELTLAVSRHATSKLNSAEDLHRISTLGFRGEALASIGSVARLTLISQASEAEPGAKLVVDGGSVGEKTPLGGPRGTLVRVENLFFNVPARLKFLKSNVTERRQIDDLVTRYALAYPEVRFQLRQDGRLALETSGNGDRREILAALYGAATAGQMIEVLANFDGLSISGYISPVSLTRSNRREITFFVNGRWIQDTTLTTALIKAYHTLLMVGRYPLTILFLELDPEEVDVNVHPAKAEVRFRDRSHIFSSVQRAVRRALLANSPVPGFEQGLRWTDQSTPSQAVGVDGARFTFPEQPEGGLSASGESNWYSMESDRGKPDEVDQSAQANKTTPLQTRSSVPLFRLVGQVASTYLVAEAPDGLYLIDQHAAHERILFERYMNQLEATIPAQVLLKPVSVDFPPASARLLADQLPILDRLGFQVEVFGTNTFLVRAIPAILAGSDPASALRVLVEDFEEDESPLQSKIEARIIARVCKRAAVKAGKTLSTEEQQVLLTGLEACQSPRTCPHGRPTMIHLSVDLLERQFGRRGAR
jgi:DNA mismatch repair protein MutL